MADVVPIRKAHPRVEVGEACGEWFVRVIEEDQELTQSFELESYALAFAEGQRMRLHLNTFLRL
ncbi:hypothetical protein NKI61_14880 [Mesorhizobium sp. M0514]|uniref:hypothetical protein n=1 Tax=unclassified Mesorhizobium TaxID=325217 RepID=UPI0004CF6119|nr:hypothetical protein [Mesorhizobium sp. L2C085B000]